MTFLRSDIWCAAFVRLHNNLGHFCVVAKKGHESAGQIWIEVDHLDGKVSLYSPAPFLKYDNEKGERFFECRLHYVDIITVKEKIAQELNFDPDIWVLALEMRDGDIGIDLV
jgi:hypothetical protein